MKTHDPIQLLMDEHEVIRAAGDRIRAIDQLWKKDARQYEIVAGALISFFREYGDRFHHHKEEVALFPAMSRHPEFMQHEMIGELEAQHELFREHLGKAGEALDTGNWATAQKHLTQYLGDLLDHIAAENDELFPMAEALFSGSELERMYFVFTDMDDKFGVNTKKELVNLLHFSEKANHRDPGT